MLQLTIKASTQAPVPYPLRSFASLAFSVAATLSSILKTFYHCFKKCQVLQRGLTILKGLVNSNHDMKTHFKLPTTKMCIVVWYRDGEKHEQLMNTPANNDRLVESMLKHKVGYSEIRCGLIG